MHKHCIIQNTSAGMERTMDKSEMEIRALVNNISQKELLDFYSAFEQVTGYSLESPFINQEYLYEEKDRLYIAIRALLVQKMSQDRIDATIAVFQDYAETVTKSYADN